MTSSLPRKQQSAISIGVTLLAISAASLSICLFIASSSSTPSSLLDTDGISSQWSAMNGQASGPAAAEQQYLDNLALQSFRREHESSLQGYVTTNTGSVEEKPARSKNSKKASSKSRGRRHKRKSQQPTFYEPTLPASATQGWSDLLSRVTRELASDTFDIEEMKVRHGFLINVLFFSQKRAFAPQNYTAPMHRLSAISVAACSGAPQRAVALPSYRTRHHAVCA